MPQEQQDTEFYSQEFQIHISITILSLQMELQQIMEFIFQQQVKAT